MYAQAKRKKRAIKQNYLENIEQFEKKKKRSMNAEQL